MMWGSLTIPPAKSLNGTATTAAKRQLSVAGARTVVPLVYGDDTFGWRVLNVIKAADNTDALVQGLWCFAGDSVNDVKLNDLALPAGASITHYTGAQTTADALLVAAFAAQSIAYSDTLNGFMYSVLRLPAALFTGELKLTARVRGRKLYDPRKDSTAGGAGAHRLATPGTWEWSACPALALGDWLASTVYGAGRSVQWASVATTAAANDATIGTPAEARRKIGLAFIGQSGLQEMADTLRAYAGCFLLPESAGIRLLPDADAATAATFRHASGEIASMAPLGLRDLGNSPTAVEVFYTDTTKTPWSDSSAVASLPGAGSTLPWRVSQVRMPGVQRYSQANREAIERLNKLTLQDLSTYVDVFDVGIGLQMADVVEITHPIGVTNKKFRVLGVDLVGLGRWRLQLLEHDPASYSDEVEAEPTYTNSGAVISEADGAGGAGISSYMIEIYRQSALQPDTPQGGSYTFTGDVFVPPAGWGRAQPAGGLTPTWASRYLVQTTTPNVAVDIPSGICDGGPSWAAATVGNREHLSLAGGNGRLVIGQVVGGNATAQWSSDGGVTWNNAATTLTGTGGYGLRLASGNGIFLAHINAIAGAVSANGDTWSSFAHGSISSVNGPIFGFGKFYVFSDSSGAVDNYYCTADGITVTYGSHPIYSGNEHGAFGGGRMVIVGSNGGTPYAAYSVDGTTFTAATTVPAITVRRVAYGAGVFVGVRAAGVSNGYSYTTDGITWTTGTLPASKNWRDVIFAQGVFVVCCTGDNAIATSTDGINWTLADAAHKFTDAGGFDRMAYDGSGRHAAIRLATTTVAERGFCSPAASWAVPNKHVVDGIDAAKELHIVTPASTVTVTWESTIPDAYGRNTPLAEVTFVAANTGKALMYAEAVIEYTATNALGGVLKASLQNAAVGFVGWNTVYGENVPNGQTKKYTIATSRTFDVVAGTSYTFGFIASKYVTADTVVASNIEARVHVVAV
jgi:hypothetical protein